MLIRRDPYFVKGKALKGQDTDHILEGVLQALPFDVDSVASMSDYDKGNDLFVVSFAVDRAATNFTTARWIGNAVMRTCVNTVVHVHSCSAHGVPLAKSRSKTNKSSRDAAFSLSRFLRIDSNVLALHAAMENRVANNVLVLHAPYPERQRSAANRVIDLLFFNTDTTGEHLHLQRENKRGELVESSSLVLARDLLSTIDLLREFPGQRFVHWCYVTPEMALVSGKQVGGPCCDSREESIEKNTNQSVQLSHWQELDPGLCFAMDAFRDFEAQSGTWHGRKQYFYPTAWKI